MNANQERLTQLPKEELEAAIDLATYFAVQRMRKCYWKGTFNGFAPGGTLAKDVVQEAFEDILAGAKWDQEKDLLLVLKGIIRGKINHLAESWENRTHTSEQDLDPRAEGSGSRFETLAVTEQSPSHLAEEKDLHEQFLLELTEELADEPDLKAIVDSVWEGTMKRSEVAEQVGMTVEEVTNAMKRLRRRLEKFRGKFLPPIGIK